jgi:hypothetical protein
VAPDLAAQAEIWGEVEDPLSWVIDAGSDS